MLMTVYKSTVSYLDLQNIIPKKKKKHLVGFGAMLQSGPVHFFFV